MPLEPQIPLAAAQQPGFAQQAGQAIQLAGAYEKQQEIQQQRQDQQFIQEALRAGANFNTPEGLAAAAEQLKGKVSPQTYQTLTQAHSEMMANEAKQEEAYAKMQPELIEGQMKQFDFIAQNLQGALSAYDSAKTTKGEQGALQDFEAAKNQIIQNASQQQMPGGRPLVNPQLLKQFQGMNPAQVQSALESTKYQQDRAMAGLKLKKMEQDIKTSAALEGKYKREPSSATGAERTAAAGGLAGTLMAGGNVGIRNMPIALKDIQDKYPWLDSKQIGTRVQQAKSLRSAITDQTKQLGRLTGFEKTVMANIENLDDAVKEARAKNKVDIPAANMFLNSIKRVAGIPQNEAVALYGQEVAAELAKLASSANASGVGGTLHDRQEWGAFFSRNGSYDQIMKSIEAAKQSAKNRIDSSKEAIAENEKLIDDLWEKPSDQPEKIAKKTEEKPKESTVVPRETSDILSILKKHGVK